MTPAVSPQRSRPAAVVPRHVLLVEDNRGDADLTCERLAEAQGQPLEVSRAVTLAQALDILNTARPIDAIILDLNLPDSQGIETVRRVRIVMGGAPIIALSGQVDEALRTQVRNEGAEDLYAKDESNSRLFWRSVLQIIDRRRAQQRQFQTLLDASPDGILLVNDAGVVRYVNHAAVELFGRSREELLNEPLGFSVVDGQPTEIRIRRADGVRDCEMLVVRVDWDDEGVWLASVRDVSDRKRNEALQERSRELEFENRRVEAANRLKGEFLANMSHELRTPLNAIIGFSQLLKDEIVTPGSPKYQVFLGHILASGEHLLRLIDDVLDMAKVESGKLRFVAEPADLRKLTEEVAAVLAVIAAKKNIGIRIHCDPALTDIQLDRGRFKQILYNYLSNALKFSVAGGQVDVRIQALDEDRFRLEVRDGGMGIAERDIGKLFNAFQQLDSSLSKQHPGTGLGLALTKRLVEAQGGSVGVSSIVGQGSEFFAVLPRRVSTREV